MPDNDAWQRATDTFNREFGTGAAAATAKWNDVTGKFDPAGGLPIGPRNNATINELRRDLPLSTLFQSALGEQTPSGGFGPLADYLGNQEGALSNLYRYGQASGALPDTTGFKDFIASRGGINRPDPREYRGFAESGARVLTPSTEEGMEDAQAKWRAYLQGSDAEGNLNRDTGMNRQFELAAASQDPEGAREFRGLLKGASKRAFERFRYDQPEKDYLTYLANRGFRFF